MPFLTLLILVPLLAALLVVLIPGNYKFVIRLVSIAATLVTLVLALAVFLKFQVSPLPFDGKPGVFQLEQKIPWVESSLVNVNYHVGVDGLNIGLVLMAAIVAFAATCVSWDIKMNEKMFYTLLLLMTGGALGAFCSLDLFFLYFFNELALVPTFIMIGVWGRGSQKNYAAYQITLYLTLGAMIALAGLIALYAGSGVNSLDIATLKSHFASNPLSLKSQHLIFPLLLFGFGILVGLFPFHSWAPLGYGSAPTATAMMHAGVLKKVGLYAIIRVALPFMPEAAATWLNVLAWLCIGNILFVGWVAMRQKDLNLLIGNSSVAHMGFVFLGIASVSLIGLTGAVVIMVAHGLLAALSYALTGYIYSETKSLEISKLGGLLRKMPFIGAIMVACFMAGCGLPGFGNFAGELLVMIGAWKSLHFFVVCAAWGGLVIGAIYMLRAIRAVLHGPVAEKMDAVGEFTIKDPLPENTGDLGALGGLTKAFHSALGGNLWQMWRKLPYALLLVALMVIGFFPSILTNRIRPAVAEVVAAARLKTTAVAEANQPADAVAAARPNVLPTAQ